MLFRSFCALSLSLGLLPAPSPHGARNFASGSVVSPNPTIHIRLAVSPKPVMLDTPRIGINLGIWTSWGAEQLGSNLVRNPGFEGVIDRTLATVKSSQGSWIALDGAAVRRSPDYWKGATAEIRTGPSAGKSAQVEQFDNTAPVRIALTPALHVTPGDIVILAKVDDKSLPTQWWFPGDPSLYEVGPRRARSSGARSIVLCPSQFTPAEMNSFLDGITARSGKLLLIEGRWRFSFWSKTMAADQAGDRGRNQAGHGVGNKTGRVGLDISFRRTSAPPFFSRTIAPSPSWQQTVIDFDAKDLETAEPHNSSPGAAIPLQLHFSAAGPGKIAIDDVSLLRVSDGEFPFRSQVVAALDILRPG